MVLRQGVYHQIKRMFGVYGAGVNELRRTAIGDVYKRQATKEGKLLAAVVDVLEEMAKEVTNIDEAVDTPVSYTHLDVYKRQILVCGQYLQHR